MDDFEKMIRGDQGVNTLNDRELQAVKAVLATRTGRRFFFSLLGICHFGRSAFAGDSTNTSQALAGKQLVGEWAMGLLNLTSPEAYGLMVKEAREDDENDRRNASRTSGDTNTSSTNAFEPDTSGDQPG